MWILPKNLEFYPSSQDMEGSKEGLNELVLELEQSLLWRSKPTLLRTWLTRWKRVKWFRILSSRMLKPYQYSHFIGKLIVSLGDSHVSRSVQQGIEKQMKTLDTSSHTSCEQLSLFDHDTCSLRTSLDFLAQNLGVVDGTIHKERPFSCMSLENWNDWVIEQKQEYSQRKKQEHHINEKECLSLRKSWGTPNTMNILPARSSEKLREAKKKGGCSNLREQVVDPLMNWPTASVIDSEGGQQPLIHLTQKGFKCEKVNRPGKTFGAKLRDATEHLEQGTLQTFPSPRVAMTGDISENRKRDKFRNLEKVVSETINFGTPRVSSANGVSKVEVERGDPKKRLECQVIVVNGHQDPMKNSSVGKNRESWPTPTMAEAEKISNRPNYGQLGLSNHPKVHGYNVSRGKNAKSRKGETMIPQQFQEKKNVSLKLNPNWVEQLMGIPVGWTQLSDEWNE